mgnify:CR=1 FL=1
MKTYVEMYRNVWKCWEMCGNITNILNLLWKSEQICGNHRKGDKMIWKCEEICGHVLRCLEMCKNIRRNEIQNLKNDAQASISPFRVRNRSISG